ncbi:hypothetical protein ACKKBG_A02650 [Auxenochlorella protothecoides x Auxenochlorella symbiontica]
MRCTSALLLVAMLLGSLAIATAGKTPKHNGETTSMEGMKNHKSGYPDHWQDHWWCHEHKKNNHKHSHCYYWWWHHNHYDYHHCEGPCEHGEKVKPYH